MSMKRYIHAVLSVVLAISASAAPTITTVASVATSVPVSVTSVCVVSAAATTVLVATDQAQATKPILTAVGAPPRAGSMAFPAWVDNLFEYGYAQCPLARTTTYYINQGSNNANAGTNPASPRNCNRQSDVVTFVEARIAADGGNCRFRFDQNDTWWMDIDPSDAGATGYTINVTGYPNVTFDSYDSTASDPTGPATGRARFLGGYPIGWAATGWKQATNANTVLGPGAGTVPSTDYTNVWCAQGATSGAFTAMGGLNNTQCSYVTFGDYQRDSNYTNTDEFRERFPFKYNAPMPASSDAERIALQAVLDTMNTTDENAFVFDTTNKRLYVRISSATGRTMGTNAYLDVLYKTKAFIKIGNNSSTTETGCRIDNLNIIGYSMVSASASEPPIWFDIAGNAIGAVTRCKVTYGSRHLIELYGQAGAGNDGGSLMVDECEVGFHSRYDSATLVNANSGGGADVGEMELICRNVRGIGVALKGWNRGVSGSTQLIYSHAAGGSKKIGLQVSVGCGWNENILNPDGNLYSLGARSADIDTTGIDTDGLDTTKYRCFEVGTINHSNWMELPGGEPKVYVNCFHSISGIPSAFSSPGGGGGGSAHKAVMINSIFYVNDTSGVATSSCEWLQNTASSPGWLHMVNSLLVFKPGYFASVTARFCADAANDDYVKSRIFNSGVLKARQRNATSVDTVTNPANQAPSPSQGGCAGLIVGPGSLKSNSGNHQGYDSTSNPTFISYVPAEPFRLIGLMNDLADQADPVNVPQLVVDYDMFFRPRVNDAGPSGGSGIMGDVRTTKRRSIYIFD